MDFKPGDIILYKATENSTPIKGIFRKYSGNSIYAFWEDTGRDQWVYTQNVTPFEKVERYKKNLPDWF